MKTSVSTQSEPTPMLPNRRASSGLRTLRLRRQAWVVLIGRRTAERAELTRQLLSLGCHVEVPPDGGGLADWVADQMLMSAQPRWPDLIMVVGGRLDGRDLEVLAGLKRAGWPTAFLLAGLSRRQARRFERLASGRVVVADASIEPEDLLTAACWLLEPPAGPRPLPPTL